MPFNPMSIFRSFMASPVAKRSTLLGGAAVVGHEAPQAVTGAIRQHDARVYQEGASTGFEQGVETGYQQGVQQGAEMGMQQAAQEMLAAMQQGMEASGDADPYGGGEGIYSEAAAAVPPAAGFSPPAPPAPKVAPAGKISVPKLASVLEDVPYALAEALDLSAGLPKTASPVVEDHMAPLVKIAAGLPGGFTNPRHRRAALQMIRKS